MSAINPKSTLDQRSKSPTMQMQSNYPAVTPGRLPYVGRFVLPAMAGILGLYVVVHSPLRDMIAALLGLKTRACYFVCGDALSLSGALDSLAALALIAAAVLAAWIVSDWFGGRRYEG